MQLIRDRKGDMLVFVAFILPITLFVLNFTLTYGLGEYAKSTVTTAAREAARTYAVTHDQQKAVDSAKIIVQKTLSSNPKYFDPAKDITLDDDGEFCTGTVTYRVPVAVPGMFRLVGINKTMDNYLPVTSTAKFIREPEPDTGSETNG